MDYYNKTKEELIIELVKIESERVKTENTYKFLIENINDVVYEVDNKGILKFISPSIKKLLGYSPDEVIGRSFLNFVGDNKEYLTKRLLELSEKAELEHEYKLYSKTGNLRWVRISTKAKYENGFFMGGSGTMIDITEKKLTEKKLQKSEALYRSILMASPDAIIISDLEGRILFASPINNKLFGYDSSYSFNNHFVFEYESENDRKRLTSALAANSLESLHGVTEYTGIRSDGSTFDMEVNMELLRDDKEQPINILFISRDITNRKLLEAELRKSEEKYRAMAERINDVLFDVTIEGIINYLSPSIEKITGYTAEELTGKNFFDYLHSEDKPVLIEALNNLANRDSFELEHRYYMKDGSSRWVRSSAKPIFKEGKMIGGIGVLSDINERKLAEEHLRQSELRYKSFFEGNVSVMLLIDPNTGEIKDANPAACQYYGYTKSEICRLNIAQINTLAEDELATEMQLAIKEERRHFIFKHRLANGELRDVEVYSGPMEYGNSKLLYSIIHDITERKQTEEKLLKGNRLRSVISNINLAIITEKNRKKLLEKVCNIVVVSGKFQMAWIGLVDEDTKKIKPYIVDGFEDGYLSAIPQISVDDVAEGRGPTGKSIREGKLFICNDIENDPAMVLWAKEALMRNYRSSIALPLKQFDGMIGVITLYASLPDFFNSEEVELLKEVVDNISNALEAIETEKERKRAEDELRKLSRAVEQSPVSILITNIDGEIEYANPKAREMSGYSLKELLGKKSHMFQLEETSENEYSAFWQTINSGKEWHGIFHNKKKTGELYWGSSTIAPIMDDTHKITHYVSITENITQRKKAEEDLINNELALNYAQKIAKMGSWELEMATGERKCSENFYRLVGLKPFQKVGIDDYLNQIVHPDDRHLLDEKLKEIQQAKSGTRMTIRLIMPAGKIKWIQSDIVPVFEDGKLTALKGVIIDITELKETEDELRKQNERQNAIMQAMPDLIFLLDKKGTYLEYYASDSIKESLSTQKEIVGSNLNDFFNKETAELYLNKINECIDFQNLVVYDYSMQTGDLVSYLEARLVPLGNDRVLSFVRDVTGRKQNEKQIQKLLVAVTQSPVAIVITNIDGDIEFVNPAFERITGYSFDEVNGKNPRILKSGKNDERIYADLWNTIKGGKIWEGDWINKKKNGEFYWEHASITPILDKTGEIINFLAVKQDVSQQKQDEQKIRELNESLELKIQKRTEQLAEMNNDLLREIEERKRLYEALSISEQSYQSVVENVNEVIFKTDSKGLWLFLNKSWQEITGFSVEESLGQSFLNYVYPDDRQLNMDIFALLINREQKYGRHEIRYIIKDGGFRWIEVFARLGLNDKGEITGTYGTLQDITERKNAEEEARKARIEAETANAAKSEFLSRMSHELRTPMNSILGFAQLLDMGELNPGQKRGVNHILQSGKHLLDLINEVLDISRIEAGRLSISLEPIKIINIIEETTDIMRSLSDKYQINIQLIASPDTQLFVKSDRQSLKQILLNLLNNAIKYNKLGGSVEIKAQLMPKNEGGMAFIRISISDTGIGISQEDIHRLFTPFERVGAAKTQIEGTGLGLAVVKKLIGAIGGFVGMESVLGQGSTFWVELPQAEDQLKRIQTSAMQEELKPDLFEKHGTVLYIEDNVSNVELIKQILASQRPGVKLENNMYGMQATKLAIEYMPDLILLDLDLPDIHGSKVLGLLQDNEKTKEIPVVVISADAMHNQIKKLIDAGAKAYLTKPLEIVDFLRVIDEYILS